MVEKMKHTLLLVDDEENILKSLKRLLHREGYRILTATGGKQGLDILKQQAVSLIISDQRMPEMIGSKFLALAQALAPDTVRIMLTGYSDIESAMDAINKGNVYRFVSKPWDDGNLLMTIRDALNQYELVSENRRLNKLTRRQNAELKKLNEGLEKEVEARTEKIRFINRRLKKSLLDTVRVFTALLGLFDREMVEHSKRVAALSRNIAKRYGNLDNPEYELIELASLLHDIGLIGVPQNLRKKSRDQMSKSERALYEQHPVLGQMSLGGVENLDQVSVLVRAHHEHFDGSGYPDGLKEEEIPLGSRIISIADAYDDLVYRSRMLEIDALAEIKKKTWTLFDPEIVILLVEVLKHEIATKNKEEVVTLKDLKPGMVLTRDLETYSGRLLMPKGTTMKESYITKLFSFNEIDSIVDRVYVYSS